MSVVRGRNAGRAAPPFEEVGSLLGWEGTPDGELRLSLRGATGLVSICEDGSVRLRAERGDALAEDPDAAIDREPWRAAAAEVRSLPDGGVALVHGGREGGARVEVSRQPFALDVRDGAGNSLARLDGFGFADGGAVVELHSPPGELILGLGEQSGGLDRRGHGFRLRNSDTDFDAHRNNSYSSIPFLLAIDSRGDTPAARGLLFDCHAASNFDVARETPERIRMQAESGALDLSIFPGPRPEDVIRRFTARVGRTPLPPRWALGHHQSRWSYKSAREVRALAHEIRRRGIPTDAIHLDIDYMDGFRVFSWNRRRFPDPKSLIRELRDQGLRVVVIVDPGVKVDPDYAVYREGVERGVFCQRQDGSRYTLRVWPKKSALPDFNRSDVRAWWAEKHQPLLDCGVAGIWNDMNEPAGWRRDIRFGSVILPFSKQQMGDVIQRDPLRGDAKPADVDPPEMVPHESVRNLYGLQECRATRAALQAAEPERRPFVLSRSGYAGIQRYAALWTGDSWSRWSHLRDTLPMLQNLGVSGVAFCGTDIGGFAGPCSAELFARWMQIGALYPFARTHSMWLGWRQEPWRFGRLVEAIALEALELRMRLLPYLNGLFHESESTGAPVWRPLVYEFPQDPESALAEDQVMLGPSLLLAPVLERGARERELYLPPGVWWDWQSDARYRGPRRLRVAAPLERLPIFVRGGSLLPMQSSVRHTGESPDEPFILEVFPGDDGSAVLVEEDGETTAYRSREGTDGSIARTPLRLHGHAGGRLRIELGRREGCFELPPRPLRLVVHGCPRPVAVFCDGERLTESETAPGYRCQDGRTVIFLVDRGESKSLEIDPEP